jgi:hypothetical protein
LATDFTSFLGKVRKPGAEPSTLGKSGFTNERGPYFGITPSIGPTAPATGLAAEPAQLVSSVGTLTTATPAGDHPQDVPPRHLERDSDIEALRFRILRTHAVFKVAMSYRTLLLCAYDQPLSTHQADLRIVGTSNRFQDRRSRRPATSKPVREPPDRPTTRNSCA